MIRPVKALRSTNFSRDARAYDEEAIPPAALAAHTAVVEAKRPNVLGTAPPQWNASTTTGVRFPDRPMMRTLANYDSHKRADFNYRRETLDWRETKMYLPKPNKFEVNERNFGAGVSTDQPHLIARLEFPVHPALDGKPRWDSATGHGGDPVAVERASRKRLEEQYHANLAYSRAHPPKNRTESLLQREGRFQAEQRAAKARMRAEAQSRGFLPAADGTFAGGDSLAATLPWRMASAPLALSDRNALDVTKQVPMRRTTTWSLGSFC